MNKRIIVRRSVSNSHKQAIIELDKTPHPYYWIRMEHIKLNSLFIFFCALTIQRTKYTDDFIRKLEYLLNREIK